jgi:hypothetical protein
MRPVTVLVAGIAVVAVPVTPGDQLTWEELGVTEVHSGVDAADDDRVSSGGVAFDVVFVSVRHRLIRSDG